MTLENWQEQIRRGGLDLAILLAVARAPRYGLEIIRHLEASTDLVVTEGTIYPILARLTREGILEAEWVAEESAAPTKVLPPHREGRAHAGRDARPLGGVHRQDRTAHQGRAEGVTMDLHEVGEGRIRGYLFVLGRALRASLPRDVAVDALKELESHIRERVGQVDAIPDERAAVERVLAELGPPLRVAQAYSAEVAFDEAVTTGRARAVAWALWHLATTTVRGFFAALGLFVGYAVGASFMVLAVLKPIFPQNVGLFVVDGIPRSFGAQFPIPAGAEVRGGYEIVPIALAVGLAVLVVTHRGARRFLSWWRERRGPERWALDGKP